MKKVAIITARGGSKRIPRKNIKDFCGKPIIAYSIEAALESKLFDEVIVSTDDDEIAEVSKKYGAKVPFKRSKKNSDDYATTSDVLLEVLENFKNFDYFCCLYPTAPFVTSGKLVQSFDLLNKESASSLVPVVEFSFPPQRGFVINDHELSYANPEFANTRSQDLEKTYHDVGQFYWGRVSSFLEEKRIINKPCVAFEINTLEAQDIDTETDWELAEIKFNFLNKK